MHGWCLLLRWLFVPELPPTTSLWITSRPRWFPVPGSDVTDVAMTPAAADYLGIWSLYLSPLTNWLAAPTLRGTAYALALALGIVTVWSFIGGCLARRTVVECGSNTNAPWTETFRLVAQRWLSIAWSVTMPSCMLVMMCFIPISLGWVSNIPWIGGPIAGVLMIPVMFMALAMGWVAAITLLGFPLAVTAIVTERKADAFDGISRSAAYAFQRPVLLLLCILAAEALSVLGGDVLAVIIGVGEGLVTQSFAIGSTRTITDLGSGFSWILGGIIPALLSAFSFSFFWSASSVIYLLLRYDVDHTEFDVLDNDIQENPNAKTTSQNLTHSTVPEAASGSSETAE